MQIVCTLRVLSSSTFIVYRFEKIMSNSHHQTIAVNCNIEFRVWDLERFGILQRFFNALKRWSEQAHAGLLGDSDTNNTTSSQQDSTQYRRPLPTDSTQEMPNATAVNRTSANARQNAIDKPELWLLNFRPQDLKALGLPDHATSARTLREWNGITKRARKKQIKDDETLRNLADFSDMLKGFSAIEIVFVRCAVDEKDKAILEYHTALGNYESHVAVEELLLFFGFPHIINRSC
jgi:hypothetical protein